MSSPAAARSPRSSTTRRSPARSRPSPTRRCRPRPRSSPAFSKKDFGVKKGDRVILYMPMVPEALVGMLACARIGAVHSVVFGGFAPKELATRIDDCHAQGHSLGELRHRGGARRCLQAAARRRDRSRQAQARRLPDPAAPAARLRADARPRPRLAEDLGRGAGVGEERARAGAGARHRSALHPLHLGHHRHPQGRRARQRRPHGRAAMVDAKSLRRRAGRDLVGGSDIGWVVGHSYIVYAPLLHGATTILYEGKPVGTPDAGALLARHRRARCGGDVHGADRVPRHQEGRPRGQACSRNTTCRNSARCFWPASAPIPTPSNGPSGC